jgi:hypothetical protein
MTSVIPRVGRFFLLNYVSYETLTKILPENKKYV